MPQAYEAGTSISSDEANDFGVRRSHDISNYGGVTTVRVSARYPKVPEIEVRVTPGNMRTKLLGA